jgi:hypothetical protein
VNAGGGYTHVLGIYYGHPRRHLYRYSCGSHPESGMNWSIGSLAGFVLDFDLDPFDCSRGSSLYLYLCPGLGRTFRNSGIRPCSLGFSGLCCTKMSLLPFPACSRID